MIKHIKFDEARTLIEKAAAVRIDGLHYVARPTDSTDTIELSLVSDERPMRVELLREDHASEIQVIGNAILMRERFGEDAKVELFQPWDIERPDIPVLLTAETATAIMDSLHTEVCQQDAGSASAYEELYEVAKRREEGFPEVWSWVAALAEAARDKMEGMWESGEADFVDCVHMASQLFHNFATSSAARLTDVLISREKAVALWDDVLREIAEREATMAARNSAVEARVMLREIEEATRSSAGYPVGVLRLVSEGVIDYTNYGGAPMVIRRLDNGLWRVNEDKGTDSPRPVGAFKIASIPVVRA